jgi:hypothetical protein
VIGSVQPVDDWVIEYVVKRLARKDVSPAGLAVDGLVLHRRTISLPLCLRSLEEIPLLAGGTRRGHELANPRRTQRTAVEKSCPRHVSLTSVESK